MTVRTHYDNLHISPDADAQTIRAAYRRLSKQYHPDLNPDPDAHRIMQLINQAYEVLSNPERRAEHDRWIAAQQHPSPQIPVSSSPIYSPTIAQSTPPTLTKKNTIMLILGILVALILLTWQLISLMIQRKPNQAPFSDSLNTLTAPISAPNLSENPTANTQQASSPYIRAATSPNGNLWPQTSGYLDGYPIVYGQGKLRLYVDNVRNSSDVYAELTIAGSDIPLRTFFIREREHLILDRLNQGSYTIRYRQLDAGEELLSETIHIDHKNPNHTVYLQRGQAPLLPN
ncbi:MAG: J domain-containing protein [Alysiella sp.]|uniref:J domain-containing protein n=1 Tax=Alysiella sp. TaxID=1872483 RepID=UPI0026DAE1BC|nr:J domain-containing protein [Alysiella sp.]MDO4433820.1 J domain-containing protein [Alysiella sp.]